MFTSLPGNVGVHLEYLIVVIRFFPLFFSKSEKKIQSMKACFGCLKVHRKCHEFNVLFHITGFYFIKKCRFYPPKLNP